MDADEPGALRNSERAQLRFAPRVLVRGQMQERRPVRPLTYYPMIARRAAMDDGIGWNRIDKLGKGHQGPQQFIDPSAANDTDVFRPMSKQRLIGGLAAQA